MSNDEALATARRADATAHEALCRVGKVEQEVKSAKGDMLRMGTTAIQAHDRAFKNSGEITTLKTRMSNLEVAGGVRPAPDVWVKVGLIAFGLSALGVVAGTLLTAALSKLI